MRFRVALLGIAVLVLAAGLFVARSFLRAAPSDAGLPVYGELPEFTLTDQDGKPFGTRDLRGRTWVADFVFLGCSDVCPRLTERMRALQSRVANMRDVRLVTISVDPENDTPERLAEYARAYDADPRVWRFLTGPSEEVERTVVKGFKIGMGREEVPDEEGNPKSGIFQIFHGEKFVLVDARGRIRGYYDADPDGQAALVRDLRIVRGRAPER